MVDTGFQDHDLRPRHVRRTSLLVLALAFVILLLVAPDLLLLLLAGVLVALVLDAGMTVICRYTGVRRIVALLLIVALLIGGGVTVGLLAGPFMTEQLIQLGRALPEATRRVAERLEGLAWLDPVIERIRPPSGEAMARAATSATSFTFGTLGSLAVVLLTGFYLAADPAPYRRGFVALLAPELRPKAAATLDELGETLRGWLLAQLVSMTVVGVATGVGLWLLGVPLAPVLGTIAGLLGFVPNLGPLLSLVPALLLAVGQDASLVPPVILLYLGVQTVETYLVTPLVQQRAIDMPPALVFMAQILFGILYGFTGLMLAMPIAAMTMTLIRRLYVEDWLEKGVIERRLDEAG